jgi:pimeloyl-ACP methyl ester carboxylesterase
VRKTRIHYAVITLVVLITLISTTGIYVGDAVAHGRHTTKDCSRVGTQVRLTPTATSTYSVVGWLCYPRHSHPQTLQFLVPGATYDHNYWDWPGFNDKYSYVDYAVARGYATFAVDRIGTGESGVPAGTEINVPSDAYTLSQVVTRLRTDRRLPVHAQRIVEIGHSLGAAIATYQVATFGNVDALAIIGYLREINPVQQQVLQAAMWPATGDPKFKNATLPAGYLTTKLGVRGQAFYDTRWADSDVIRDDERRKAIVPVGDMATIMVGRDTQLTQKIHIPVLDATGQNDLLGCSATLRCDGASLLARERDAFHWSSCVRVLSIVHAGHDTNLHRGAQASFAQLTSWVRWVTSGSSPRTTRWCTPGVWR